MNIAVAGGTGFIGKVLLKKLISEGHHIKALIRPGSLLKITRFKSTESRYVYYDSPSQLKKSVEDCQIIINLIGISKETKDTSFEFAHHMIPMSQVKAAQDAGVKRFIHMSAHGVESDVETDYFESKRLGENVVKSSGLDWTIFRPTFVYGPTDNNINLFVKMMKWLPAFPVVGGGEYEMMPVHVDNVVDGFAQAIEKPETIGKIYNIPGPEKFTFNEMLDIIAEARGKKKAAKIKQPPGLAILGAKLFGKYLPGPISVDTVKMLLNGSASDDNTFWETFDTKPKYFTESIKEFVNK